MKMSSVSGYTQFVNDIKKSVEFYRKLGFNIVDEQPAFARVDVSLSYVTPMATS